MLSYRTSRWEEVIRVTTTPEDWLHELARGPLPKSPSVRFAQLFVVWFLPWCQQRWSYPQPWRSWAERCVRLHLRRHRQDAPGRSYWSAPVTIPSPLPSLSAARWRRSACPPVLAQIAPPLPMSDVDFSPSTKMAVYSSGSKYFSSLVSVGWRLHVMTAFARSSQTQFNFSPLMSVSTSYNFFCPGIHTARHSN